MELKPFENKLWLASPTMHGDELRYMQQAYETNWMSTVGKNINEVERIVAEKLGCTAVVETKTVESLQESMGWIRGNR
mgnify:CR=1 FL=1